MKRLFPLDQWRTSVTLLYAPQSVSEAISEAENAMEDGADAIAVELNKMPPEFRNEENFHTIVNSVPLPFMFLLYRNDPWKWSDEKRTAMLLDAARAGAGMIDVTGDLFDKSPDERTQNPDAIRHQKEVIDEIHALGSQVIMSSHPNRPMTTEEILVQLKDFEQRGADVVKIVTAVNTEDEFAESIRSALRLNHELKKARFVHLCTGSFSRIQRMLGTSLGVAITFAVHEYHDYAPYNQPTIRSFKTVQKNIRWNIMDFQKSNDMKH